MGLNNALSVRAVCGVALRRIVFAACAVLAISQSANAQPYNTFATDGLDNLIRQYDPQGVELRQIRNAEFSFPTFLVPDTATGTLITDINFRGTGGPQLVRVDLDGNIVARNTMAGIFGSPQGGMVDVVPTKRGTFFVTSTQNTQIAELDRDFSVLRTFSTGASSGGLRTLGGTLSPDGSTLLVCDVNGQTTTTIRSFDANTGALLGVVSPAGLGMSFDLAFGPDGLIYVTDRGSAPWSDGRIFVFDSAFNPVRNFNSGAPIRDNFGPFTILPNGNLLVVETSLPTTTPLRELDPYGNFVREYGDTLTNCNGVAVLEVPGATPLALSGLAAVAFLRRRR